MYHTPLLFLGSLGTGEIILIVLALLLMFGGKKIPELARGLGKGIREFKDASSDVKREIEDNVTKQPDQPEKKD